MVNPKKLETGLRTFSAGIAYTLLLGIEASGFPTFGLLLQAFWGFSGLGFNNRISAPLAIYFRT